MTRRDLLLALAAPSALADTVLVHEHILVDFTGGGTYDSEEVFRAALPKLKDLRAQGCVRMLECTPNFLGRDARLCRRLADASGLDIWTNTGLYGAPNHKYIPDFAKSDTAQQLARRWINEVQQGIDGVKPKFLKTAVNDAPLNDLDRKLIVAAAITSNETGVTIASHTAGRGPAALAQLEVLDQQRCPPSKFVWVHAQNEKDHSFHEKVAKAGAWVEFDGINEKSAPWHRDCVLWMNDHSLLDHTLISQDSGWWHVGEPNGGTFNGYTWLYTGFLPLLPQDLWAPLLTTNPRRAFGR
jgi:phosphotriesterase-related protein